MTMTTMTIRVRRLSPAAVIPSYAHPTDAGMDLTAVSKSVDDNGCVVYGTGLAFEIPEGYVGLIFPRSSVSRKSLMLSNCVGVIDSGYRGEVILKFRRVTDPGMDGEYETGERIGQIIIMPYPKVSVEEAETLADSDRGTGGYGSTGR